MGVRIGLDMSEDNVPSWNRTVVPEPSSNISLCDARIVNSTSCHILASYCSESQFCPEIALCGISHVQTLGSMGWCGTKLRKQYLQESRKITSDVIRLIRMVFNY